MIVPDSDDDSAEQRMPRVDVRFWMALAVGLAASLPSDGAAPQDPPVAGEPLPGDHAEKMARGREIFTRHVRQVLVDRCLECHGSQEVESGFNLATREGLLKGGDGGKAVVPGDAAASRLYKLVTWAEEPYMPHDAAKLSNRDLAHVADWINHYAPYDKPLVDPDADREDWTQKAIAAEARQFWSFRPLQDVRPPNVGDSLRESPGPLAPRLDDISPVDRFILAKLSEAKLLPNPPAERRQLIRRAYLDLLGLPPPPDEIEAFADDSSPDAWEQLIDRLLASPHYGERWGRHWLDLARFAESHGFEHDYDRPSAYHYRDFVVQALNADMPYDRFVRWQLAGDELAPDDRLALMATGFLAAGVHSTQITISEAERHRYDEMDDMLSTATTALLGLTVGCARCHDHKFDPIPQADYYRMLSTFTTTIRSEVDVNFDPDGYRRSKDAWDAAHAPLAAALRSYEDGPLQQKFDAWLASNPSLDQLPKWVILDPATFKSQGGATFEKQADGSVLASGNNPLHETYTLTTVVDVGPITAIRLEALADKSLVKSGPGRAGNGNFALSDFKVTARPLGRDTEGSAGVNAVPVQLTDAVATFQQTAPDLPVKAAIDVDPLSAWAVDPQFGRDHAAAFALESPLDLGGPVELTFTLRFATNVHHSIGRPRLSVSAAPGPLSLDGESIQQNVVASLKSPAAHRTPEQRAALLSWFRQRDEQWRRLSQAVADHEQQEPTPPLMKVLIASEGLEPVKLHTQSPREYFDETFFLKRGDVNQKVRVAEPGALQAVSEGGLSGNGHSAAANDKGPMTSDPLTTLPWSPPGGWQPSGRRTALARWITDHEHGGGHLLARVIVNRLWQHHFGRGLVSTPSDFGKQGEPPSHPELLDWLARRLIAHDWQLKPLHKLIMTSAVYRQSADIDPAKLRADPDNRLCWRFARRRLEAESVRDALLAVSGRLDQTLYGPGTLDPGMTRRSIYFTVKRSQLVPAMLVFDAPDALGGLPARPSTTVAPQALYLMNNEQVRRCAESLAAESRRAHPDDAAAIDAAYRAALGRGPSAADVSDAQTFLAQQARLHTEAGRNDAPVRALADLCQVLFSLNEFVYIE
jgi:cytochrome c553